jgi:hypothetical protein
MIYQSLLTPVTHPTQRNTFKGLVTLRCKLVHSHSSSDRSYRFAFYISIIKQVAMESGLTRGNYVASDTVRSLLYRKNLTESIYSGFSSRYMGLVR